MRNPLRVLRKFYTRLFYIILTILGFILFAVIGLMVIEDYSFLDALWFVTITITTVGYEVDPNFSDQAKIFTIFLMWTGIIIFLLAISIIAFELLDGTYQKAYKHYKMDKKLKALKNHVIICGFGRNGRQAARKLKDYNQQFIVIDQKPEEDFIHKNKGDILYFRGNATIEDTLIQCGIEKAKAVIAAMPSDADNLYMVITAKQLNPNIKIISRASNSNSIAKLKSVGANNVIMPDKVGGEHMASLVVTPDLVEFIEQIKLETNNNVNLLEISTNQIEHHFLESPILEYHNHLQTQCIIIGYKTKDNHYIINPDHHQVIKPDEYIIFFGRNGQILDLKRQLNLG